MPKLSGPPSQPVGIVLRHAEGTDDIAACFPVISVLRPHVEHGADWVDRASRMVDHGYRVLAAWEGRRVLALAGYRAMENLVHGRFVYVDDLVSAPGQRRQGLGAALLAELSAIGGQLGCGRLVLDTAVTNAGARRFYARQGLAEVAVGLVKALGDA